MSEKIRHKRELSLRETICYSTGEMGTNILFAVMGAYLLVYYTNYAHINPGIVGTIMLVSKIIDAISDVVMGVVMEKCAKPGAEKARPWLKRIVIPYALAAIVMFSVPEMTSTVSQVIYVFVTYNLFCTLYTMIVIPYTSMQALISKNEKDRENTSVLRSIFNTVASTIVNSYTMTFIGWAGDTKRSWSIVIGCYALLSLAAYALCYFNTKERVVSEAPVLEAGGMKKEKLGVVNGLKLVLKNKFWLVCTCMSICSAAVISLNMGSMYYYLAYVCGKPQAVPIVGMLLSMPMLILIPLSKPVVAKSGVRNGLVLGLLVMIIGRTILALGGSASLAAIYAGSFLFAIGCSTQWCAYPMLCNTVEYGEWKNGMRQEGLIMSANSFGSKVGSAIGTALCSWVLEWTGYNGEAQVQSASAMTGISIVYVVLPIALNIICIIAAMFYTLEKQYPTIVKELEERKKICMEQE